MQPQLVAAGPDAVIESAAQSLIRRQASIKDDANAALESLTARIKSAIAEAHDLSKVQGVFPKPVEENLEKFVAFATSASDVFTRGAQTTKSAA